jgi:hypothetical protein
VKDVQKIERIGKTAAYIPVPLSNALLCHSLAATGAHSHIRGLGVNDSLDARGASVRRTTHVGMDSLQI